MKLHFPLLCCLSSIVCIPVLAQDTVSFPTHSGVELHQASRSVVLDTDGSGEDRAGRMLSDNLSRAAILSGAAFLLENHKHHGEARDAFTGMAITGLATVALKKAINEPRPVEGGGSFPSGHTSLAFSLATVISTNHPKYTLLAYGAATAVGWARVEVQAHYWHDVIAGAALGYFTTKHFMHHRVDFTSKNLEFAVTPQGIGLQKQF